MSIEIKTAVVEPLRTTFDHLEERLGKGKVPSRYQEAVFDLQATLNFHYRPTWDPEGQLYDPARTALHMEDWDQLTDPRQYYYASYVMARGRQQESQEKNFSLAEKKDLVDALDESTKDRVRALVVPLRHAEWGANQLNAYIAGYGSGAAITSAATFQMVDRLGNAQYLSRLGLLLEGGEPTGLDRAKSAWLEADHWQPLRRLVEDLLVVRDWFEVHLAQNLLLDALLQPLVFQRFQDDLDPQGGTVLALLSEFTTDWYGEAHRWVDAVVKRAAGESAENAARLSTWAGHWMPRVRAATEPLAGLALGDGGASALDSLADELRARAAKIGVEVP